MAEFNLGCIKGSKGDAGPKGDKGDKGDTGARGPAGADGLTPVFSIGVVETLDAGYGARVEVDSGLPENPILNFYIPKGKDGKDSSGDMNEKIYDPTGKKEDIYKYAENLFKKCVDKNGATMEGNLVAGICELQEKGVRNISFSQVFPTSAANGDMCFLLPENNGKYLSECETGTSLLLDECNEKAEYIIVEKNYNNSVGIILIRKYLPDETQYFAYNRRPVYAGSDIDVYLESIYCRKFSEYIQKKLFHVELGNDCVRQCFLPSREELAKMEYFRSNPREAACVDESSCRKYMTRDIIDSKTMYAVDYTGNFGGAGQSDKINFRPMICLPEDMLVENSTYNRTAVVVPVEKKTGIYLFKDGIWEEMFLNGDN